LGRDLQNKPLKSGNTRLAQTWHFREVGEKSGVFTSEILSSVLLKITISKRAITQQIGALETHRSKLSTLKKARFKLFIPQTYGR